MDESQLTDHELDIFGEAKRMLERGTSCAEFSNRFFSPGARLSELWETQEDRERLVDTPLFRWLQDRASELEQREMEAYEEEVAARQYPPTTESSTKAAGE